MAKQQVTSSEIVEKHKPKNFKFAYVFSDKTMLEELYNEGYDISSLDTINDDELLNAALSNIEDERTYDRTIVGKAKQPTVFDDGVVITKKMVTKADKKLQCMKVGYFSHNERRYVKIEMVYERFSIIEIFLLL